MTTPDSARLEAIARETHRSFDAYSCESAHTNLGTCVVCDAILAALVLAQSEPTTIHTYPTDAHELPPGFTNIGADWDRARDARQDVVAEIPLVSLKTAPTSVEGFYQRVNARAEADIMAGGPVAGALHRAMQVEIAAFRGTTPPAGEPR